MCGWVGQSGDVERREGQRASGARMEKGNENAWGTRNVVGQEEQRGRLCTVYVKGQL